MNALNPDEGIETVARYSPCSTTRSVNALNPDEGIETASRPPGPTPEGCVNALNPDEGIETRAVAESVGSLAWCERAESR